MSWLSTVPGSNSPVRPGRSAPAVPMLTTVTPARSSYDASARAVAAAAAVLPRPVMTSGRSAGTWAASAAVAETTRTRSVTVVAAARVRGREHGPDPVPVVVLAEPVEQSAQHLRVGDVVVVVDAVGGVAQPGDRGEDLVLDRADLRQRVVLVRPVVAGRDVLEVAGVDHEAGAGEDLAQEVDVGRQVLVVPADLLVAGDPRVGLGTQQRRLRQRADVLQRGRLGERLDAEPRVCRLARTGRVDAGPLGQAAAVELVEVPHGVAV